MNHQVEPIPCISNKLQGSITAYPINIPILLPFTPQMPCWHLDLYFYALHTSFTDTNFVFVNELLHKEQIETST